VFMKAVTSVFGERKKSRRERRLALRNETPRRRWRRPRVEPPRPRRGMRNPQRSAAKTALLLTAAISAGAITATAFSSDAEAQQRRRRRVKTSDLTLKGSVIARPLVLIGALAVLTLLPFVIIMITSFVKISVVLSIVRSAIGTQQIPPTQVITGLAIILTVYIMAPVGLEIYRESENLINERRPGSSLASAETVDLVFEAMLQAKEPVKAFLMKNSHVKDRVMFYRMAVRLRKPEDQKGVGPEDFMVIVPSFVISELKEAFQIGFIIFVPFLVIDMIVANILMALGMQMLSPTTISLPFKLLLFVMIDGWYLITKGLITGYI
jgi:type III secretion protein R